MNKEDIYYIEYWYEDDDFFLLTPVRVKEKINNRKYLITHNVKGSYIQNAPDEIVNKNQLLK